LARGVRLVHDQARSRQALLYPEGVLMPNQSAEAVLRRCDGTRSVADIAAELSEQFDQVPLGDVRALVEQLLGDRLIEVVHEDVLDRRRTATPRIAPAQQVGDRLPMPLGMLAELTYRCPLQCAYCSNPVELAAFRSELDTASWLRVLAQARELGVLQVHLSGGEPLVRRDLVEIVRQANDLGMYTNLVTSGAGLTERRLDALVAAGLDHVQLSIQDAQAAAADRIAGINAHARKLVVADLVTARDLPLTINVVLHRDNIDQVTAMGELAAELGADRLELANTQYYGWALLNWSSLLPSREQIDRSREAAAELRTRFGDRMTIVYVLADYYEKRPKPCLHGWGARQFVVDPTGDVLPCPAAAQIPDLGVRNVRDHALADIWYSSPAFTRFRGTDWLPSPCRDCALKDLDFGGCRCQAYQLTGDAAATDPVCELSPEHHRVERLLSTPASSGSQPRRMR
jgi:pyrroloquinoline quinone biosynthesis protein E